MVTGIYWNNKRPKYTADQNILWFARMEGSGYLTNKLLLFIYLFGVYQPTREFFTLEFSLKWRCHHYQWRAANFDLCSALMSFRQWGFFSVSHLLWHGISVYNGHLRGPVTLTPIPESLAVELSLSVFTTYLGMWRPGFEQPTLRLRDQCSKIHCEGSLKRVGSVLSRPELDPFHFMWYYSLIE